MDNITDNDSLLLMFEVVDIHLNFVGFEQKLVRNKNRIHIHSMVRYLRAVRMAVHLTDPTK